MSIDNSRHERWILEMQSGSILSRTAHRRPYPDDCPLPVTTLKHGIRTGNLSLASRGLKKVPLTVWRWHHQGAEPSALGTRGEDLKWWEMEVLRKLDCCHNDIEAFATTEDELEDRRKRFGVPDEDAFEALKDIQVLLLSHNQLTYISPDISVMGAVLTKLDISHNNLESLPAEIGALTGVEWFSASHNRLHNIPKEFIFLTGILHCDVSHNQLRSIDDLPPNCQMLNLSHNCLTDLPVALFELAHVHTCELQNNNLGNGVTKMDFRRMRSLRHLDLRENNFLYCPIFGVGPSGSSLAELFLSFNQLTDLDRGIWELSATLKVLDVKDNQLSSLPNDVVSLHHLTTLDISNNNIRLLNPLVGYIRSLTRLQIVGNPLRSLRADLLQKGTQVLLEYLKTRCTEDELQFLPSHLRSEDSDQLAAAHEQREQQVAIATGASSGSLSLCGCSLAEFPGAEVLPDSGLVELVLRENSIARLPGSGVWEVWSKMSNIHTIDLSENQFSDSQAFEGLNALAGVRTLHVLKLEKNALTEIPEAVCHLQHLVELHMSCNRVTRFPSTLPSTLEVLDVSQNQVNELGDVLYTCVPQLRILLLNDNHIQALSHRISGCSGLEVLQLCNNDLSQIPDEIGHLQHLRSVQLYGNRIRPMVANKSIPQLVQYLRMRLGIA